MGPILSSVCTWLPTSFHDVQAPNNMAHSQSIGHEALRQYADYHLDHLGPYFPSVAGKPAVIPESKSFNEFVFELKRVLDRQPLPERAFDWIFSPHQILNKPRPNCGGAYARWQLHKLNQLRNPHPCKKHACPEPVKQQQKLHFAHRLLVGVWRVGRSHSQRCS